MRFFCLAFTLVVALTYGQGCRARSDKDVQNDSAVIVKDEPIHKHYIDVDRLAA